VAELRFRVGAIFPADNPTARYVMAVSIVLGDLRIAAGQAALERAAPHERLYFDRLLDLHVREGLCLAVLEHRKRDDVRRFVSILPGEAREARDELERALADGSGRFGELETARPDTFRCARMIDDTGGLREAMERLAQVESGYRLVGEGKRADYADLVVASLASGPDSHGAARDALVERLFTFMEHAEAAWLRPWRG
jgi:hypothetical protein